MKNVFSAAVLLLLVSFALVGCAPSNLYIKKNTTNPFDLRLYGYSDSKIQEGVYRIGYTGGSNENAQDLVMLRAAEVVLKNGYKYFTIQQSADSQQTLSSYTPMILSEYKGVYYGSGFTNTSSMPDIWRIIQCHQSRPTDASGIVYDASEISANLKSKYGIKDK